MTLWTYDYHPYGVARTTTQNSNKAPTNLIRFTGEYLDPTGLYHLRARQYDPSIGRFLATDPVACSVGVPCIGAYAYANDNPIRFIDPSGRETQAARSEAATRCVAVWAAVGVVDGEAALAELYIAQALLAAGPVLPVQAALLIGDTALGIAVVGTFVAGHVACGG